MTCVGRIVVITLAAFGLSATAHAQTAQADDEHSPGHVFWVLPAFNVDNQQQADPLTPRQKFDLWAQGAADPIGLAFKGVQAGLEHSSSGFCGYSGGLSGYGKCYAAGVADGDISTFIGNYAFAALFQQDPRYFRRGEGGARHRLTYSLSQVFVRRQDSGATAANTALIGTVIAGATSNLYYPRAQRGVGLTMSRIGWDLGSTALFNIAAEYWPDVQRHLHHAPTASVQKSGQKDKATD
jgi:hypothetical protein